MGLVALAIWPGQVRKTVICSAGQAYRIVAPQGSHEWTRCTPCKLGLVWAVSLARLYHSVHGMVASSKLEIIRQKSCDTDFRLIILTIILTITFPTLLWFIITVDNDTHSQ